MRKTSHDGGDNTSITSGFENETRKTSIGMIKTKRNSIKRKVQNFSHDSDDTVIEPLLQIDKSETNNRSAKYLLSKSKTDSMNEKENNVHGDNKYDNYSVSKPACSTGTTNNSNVIATLHNHMNTNVFGGYDASKVITTARSPVLVEISGCRASGNSNQTSSIFTTAKIHADSITKTIAPMQVTPLPILSTVEGGVVKAGISSDNSLNKNVEPSTSNFNLKTINYDTRTGIGKSDLHTQLTPKNKNTVLDSRPVEITTKCEPLFFDKSCNTQKVTVTSVTNKKEIDIDIKDKFTEQLQSSITTISEHKGKSCQQTVAKAKTEIVDTISLQNKSSITPNATKDSGITQKEDKVISSSSGASKQLQRQKNAIAEDLKDTDMNLKNLTEVDKFSGSTDKDSLIKDDVTKITETERLKASILTSTSTKSKENEMQSTGSKTDSVTANKTTLNSNQIGKPLNDNLSLASSICKEITPKTFVSSIEIESISLKDDALKSKKCPENQISKSITDNPSVRADSTKNILTSITTDQPSQAETSYRSDSAKGLKGDSSVISKPVADNSSLTADKRKKIISKPDMTIQPTQVTVAFVSDSLKEKSAAEFTGTKTASNMSTVFKAVTAEPSKFVQPSHSGKKLISDTVKGKTMATSSQTISKLETDKFSKETHCISSTVGPIKPAITTSSRESSKNDRIETSSIPKSVATTTHMTSSHKTDFKTSGDSQPYKYSISQATSTAISGKDITTNLDLPISSISVIKTESMTKQPSRIPSSSAVVTSKAKLNKNESSNKSISSTTSSLSSTSPASATAAKLSTLTPSQPSKTASTTSTVAKSSTSTSHSSNPKSHDKHGKI